MHTQQDIDDFKKNVLPSASDADLINATAVMERYIANQKPTSDSGGVICGNLQMDSWIINNFVLHDELRARNIPESKLTDVTSAISKIDFNKWAESQYKTNSILKFFDTPNPNGTNINADCRSYRKKLQIIAIVGVVVIIILLVKIFR